jgi:hypothetical protein
MRLEAALVIVLLVLSVGCGRDENVDNPEPAAQTAAPWQTLISGEWSMPGGTEGYRCVRETVMEDLYISAFDAIIPQGTHHTLLTMGAPNAPDGISTCNAGTNHTLSLFGSGVGTDPMAFPKGVAMKVPKGTQLLLNLHLFNTGHEELSGKSGTRIRTIAEKDVVQVAEGMLAGTIRLNIPAGETTKHVGFCTMSHDSTLIAVAPHMHQLGIYEKVVAETSRAGEVTLFDGPYDFNEQSYQAIRPLVVAKGDRVRVECTHRNTTTKRVTFGESTLAEMCFAGLYRYPAGGQFLICSNDFPLRPDGGLPRRDAGPTEAGDTDAPYADSAAETGDAGAAATDASLLSDGEAPDG